MLQRKRAQVAGLLHNDVNGTKENLHLFQLLHGLDAQRVGGLNGKVQTGTDDLGAKIFGRHTGHLIGLQPVGFARFEW